MSRVLSRLSCLLSFASAGLALYALAGYVSGDDSSIALLPGLQGMSPLTAFAICFVAGAAVALATARSRLARVCTLLAAAIALAVLASHAITGVDVLSEPMAAALFGPRPLHVGRMSVATAVSLLLLCAAALTRRRRADVADPLAGLAAAISGVALLGYAYGVQDLYRIPVFNTMAVNTAACLFALSIAVMASLPASGWAAVLAHRPESDPASTRRMLGLLALAPLVGAALARAGAAGRVGLGAALALLVTVMVVPLAWFALRDGRARIALEAERARAAEFQAGLAVELETRLAQSVLELRKEVAERANIELAMQRSQRLEAVGRLTGGIAHDFNNLLQALSGNIALLKMRIGEGDPLRRFVDGASKAVQKGAKLTAQLLAFSRTQRLTIGPVMVRAAMQEAHELMRHSLGPDIQVDVDMPADGLWVASDAQQIELALMNLAMNARDAMPGGGVLRMSARTATAVAGLPDRAFVALRVADTGTGMAAEVAARAGEPFFTTKPQGQGNGLGLAQVYGFARQCGGDVRIESEPGHGTSVTIFLPQSEPRPLAGEPHEPAAVARLAPAGRKVLLIDDDDSVREALVQGLRDAGYDVAEASHGLAGLAQIERAPPEVAVIDFMMPGLNGAEVARRAQAMRPGLPVIFVSGYSDTLALDSVANASVLRKPFAPEVLANAIAEVLTATASSAPG